MASRRKPRIESEPFVPWITVNKIMGLRRSAKTPSMAERRALYIDDLAEADLADLVAREINPVLFD